VTKSEVRFASGSSDCAGWWYGAGASPAPCVVMAHGFSLTMRDGLAAYAEAFAAAGFHVLVFDHRHLGESGGERRGRFRIGEQQDDWRRAIEFARSRPGVDPARIHLWGYSFAGGHVVTLLGQGVDVAGAMVLCPFLDGLRRVLDTPPLTAARIIPRAVLDTVGRTTYIPVTGPPGTVAAMPFAGEEEGFAASIGPESRWANRITPAVFLNVGLFRPVRRARKVTVPLWVGRCADDITVSAPAVGRLAERAPAAELHDYPGDHFAPFHGDLPARIIADQVAFLTS
jgi:alpha-beta hydrolase superfamily lysophospholipase